MKPIDLTTISFAHDGKMDVNVESIDPDRILLIQPGPEPREGSILRHVADDGTLHVTECTSSPHELMGILNQNAESELGHPIFAGVSVPISTGPVRQEPWGKEKESHLDTLVTARRGFTGASEPEKPAMEFIGEIPGKTGLETVVVNMRHASLSEGTPPASTYMQDTNSVAPQHSIELQHPTGDSDATVSLKTITPFDLLTQMRKPFIEAEQRFETTGNNSFPTLFTKP